MARDISRRYVSISSGQAHLRETAPVVGQPPLYCLHATAYSGRTFEPFMQALAGRRRCVAPDTPGYGGSDRPEERWDIPRYAQALAETIEAAGHGPVDLFGYHTGALIGTELAALRPDLVRRIVLVGMPFFEGAAREAMHARLAHEMTLTDQLSQFDERWAFFIANRPKGVPLELGYRHFVDELIAWPYGFWAHDVAFRYDAAARLPLAPQPTLVLNPENHLSQASRDAAALMPGGRVIELPHLSHAVLDLAGPELAERTDEFLRAAL